MEIEIALNQSALMNTPIEEFLELCFKWNIRHVELQINSLKECLYHQDFNIIRRKLDDYNISVISLNSFRDFSLIPNQNLDILVAEAELIGKMSSEVQSPFVVAPCARMYGRDFQLNKIMDYTVERINVICNVFAKYNVKVAFEPVGYHDYSVQSIKIADEIVQRTSSQDNGLVIDVYNLFISGTKPLDLYSIKSKIHIFHINDAELFPLKFLDVRRTRAFPGDGFIKPEKWVVEAVKLGFRGPFSLEIFPQELWDLPAEIAMYKIVMKIKKFKELLKLEMHL